jgi:integrase/recombinase XerD
MTGPQPRLHLPYPQWPAADRILWQRAIGSDDDPFADAPGARLSKASLHNYFFAWRRWLGFLAIHEPTALELAPAERFTIERVRAFAKHLAETNTPISVAGTVAAVYHAARVMMPQLDWTWLKTVKARLYRAAPASPPIGPVITSVQLRELGEQLMDESKPSPNTPISKKDAAQYRDGLMIVLLASIPIRRKNVAALEIGRHLVREGDSWSIIIPREEMKTRTPVEYTVPEFLHPYLATYLDIIRPQMVRVPITQTTSSRRRPPRLRPMRRRNRRKLRFGWGGRIRTQKCVN